LIDQLCYNKTVIKAAPYIPNAILWIDLIIP
jgi:hypothetical protein